MGTRHFVDLLLTTGACSTFAMSDKAASPAPAKKAKAPKKKATPAAHPAYGVMVKAAIVELKEKKGSSRAAILKYILANYKIADEKKGAVRVKLAIRKALESGALTQAKKGSNGLIKAAKEAAPVKKAAPKKKAATPKKKDAAKKTAVKKTKKAATPKKAAKKPAKKATPKKAAKKPAKKAPAKKTAKK